jgi:uncharacterized membrane protein
MRGHDRPVLLALAALVIARAVGIASLSMDHLRSFTTLWPIDLANVNQAIWNTAHGRPYFCTIYYQALRDHFDPMLMLFAPIYLLTDDIFWLFLAYAALVGSGAMAVYLLARRTLSGVALPLLFALYFLAFAPLFELTVLEIRGDMLAVPFLLLAWLGYAEKRFPLFAAAAALAMTCKETVALVMVLWGLLALLQRRPLKWVLLPAATGAAVLLFTLFVYHPYIQGFAYKHVLYEHPPRVLGTGLLLAPSSWWFLLRRFFAFSGVLGLLSPAPLLPATPLVVAPLLWREMLQKELWLHCLAPAYPFLLVALIQGTRKLLGALSHLRRPRLLVGAFLAASTAGALIGAWPTVRPVAPDGDDRAAWELIDEIPPRASVSASPLALAALSSRPLLHSLAIKDHRGRDIDPLAVDYILFEPARLRLSKRVSEGRRLEPTYFSLVRRVRSDPAFELVASRGSWELYRRRSAAPPPPG